MKKSVHSSEQIVLQQLLRHLRKEQGLLQRELASKLDKPTSFVCRFEKGSVMLDMPQLRQVAHVLGLTLPELVDRYENEIERQVNPDGLI